MNIVRRVLKNKFCTEEWIAAIFIIIFVLILQFFVIRGIYLNNKYLSEKDLCAYIRWQIEDWNHRQSMREDGVVRGYKFLDAGRELLIVLKDSSYIFKLDSEDRVEDVYLRITCDLNISHLMTLQILDSVLQQNLNKYFEDFVVAFQRKDSIGRVLEFFPETECLFKNMNRAGKIKLGFISGESIDVFYELPNGFWKRYVGVWMIVGIFLAGVVVAGIAIVYIFAYGRQRKKRAHQLKWLGDDLHNLKTPVKQINGIMLWLEVKYPDVFKTQEGKEKLYCVQTYLNEILQSMEECMMTSSILHRTTLKLENINLKMLLSDLIEQQMDANVGGKEVTIELDYCLPEVVCSSSEAMTVIVRNLLDNAVKYSKKRAEILVHGYQECNKMVIEVVDHGIGISVEEQEKIFNEYYQVEENDVHGSGRGLPYVREVVEKMRGKIEVKSELGKGCCFKIYIPKWRVSHEK